MSEFTDAGTRQHGRALMVRHDYVALALASELNRSGNWQTKGNWTVAKCRECRNYHVVRHDGAWLARPIEAIGYPEKTPCTPRDVIQLHRTMLGAARRAARAARSRVSTSDTSQN